MKYRVQYPRTMKPQDRKLAQQLSVRLSELVCATIQDTQEIFFCSQQMKLLGCRIIGLDGESPTPLTIRGKKI